MEVDLSGRIALITGASSGIGRATALLFAKSGARVVAVARNAQALDAVSAEANASGGECHPLCMDVSLDQSGPEIIAHVGEKFGTLHTLVNAAGHIANGSIESTTLDSWDSMMNINLRSVFNLMQSAVPLLEQSQGSIVNVSSVTGLRAFPGVLAYCVSKAAVDQLTRCSALELAPKGIRVNSVNPGVVITEIHKRGGMNEDDYAKFLERSRSTHPLGRVGNASEIAELILFLASNHAGWITGANYSIDGGRAQTCAR